MTRTDVSSAMRMIWRHAVNRRGVKLSKEERVAFDVLVDDISDGFRIRAWWVRGFGLRAPYRGSERVVPIRDLETRESAIEALYAVAHALVREILPLPRPHGWRLYSRRPA